MDRQPGRRRTLDGPVKRLASKFSVSPTPALTPAPPAASGGFVYKDHPKPVNWKKRIIIGAVALVAATGLYFGAKVLLAARKIITNHSGSTAPALSGQIDPSKLVHEGDGRINILVLGIGGPGHDGPNLSDTMMVLSLDPHTHEVAMLSVPRDLYVPIKNYGWAKINAANAYGEMRTKGGGPALAKQTVTNVLDIPIHYYGLVDFSGFQKAVDAVGGVDVYVSKTIYDTEYPNDVTGRNETFYLKSGWQHMNGALALKYVRSRHSTSDFDRAARQQSLILAIRQKALTLQTLSNPIKISRLIDVVGNSARTDLQLSEIDKLASIAQQIDSSRVTTKVLDVSSGLLAFGYYNNAGSVEVPAAGVRNFSAIQAFARSYFSDSYIKGENASVEVQNGTSKNGQAAAVGAQLKSYGYNVASMVTAPRQNYAKSVIYDYTNGSKPYTINYLQNRFHVTAQKMTRKQGDPDIRIIVGADYKIAPLYSTL